MRHRVRRSTALAVISLSSLALAAPASAVVVAEGRATVVVREPSPDGGVTPGAPVPDATVRLIAFAGVPDAPIVELEALTDAAGVARFTAVPYEDADGPAIQLAVETYREVAETDDEGCTLITSWFGSAPERAAAADVAVELEASVISGLECTPRASLEGRIRGSDGASLEIDRADVSVVVPPDGAPERLPLDVDAEGRFDFELPGVGSYQEPAVVTVDVVSAPTRVEPWAGGCTRTYAEAGSWTAEAALADGEALPFVELATKEFVLSEVCDSVSATQPPPAAPAAPAEPGSVGGRPTITLPPTDVPGATAPSSGSAAMLGAIVVGLTAAGASLVLGSRRRAAR